MKITYFIEKYVWVVNLVLLVFLGMVLARTTSTAVRSSFIQPPRVAEWRPGDIDATDTGSQWPISIDSIERRNLFHAKVAEELVVETAENNGEDQFSGTIEPLDVELKGIIVGPDFGVATILDKKNNENLYLEEGDTIGTGSMIKQIRPTKVDIEREDGSIETLTLEFIKKASTGGPRPTIQRRSSDDRTANENKVGKYSNIVKKISDTEYVIDKAGFEEAMENLNELLTQAKMVPNFGPDRQADGFRIMRIRPRSIFFELGLRNRDVIKRVNGVALDDPAKGFEFFLSLKNQNSFTIDITRNNQNLTHSYEVR